ncbi:unnamed protein product, partial [Closterium sp. Naga37s-1]
NLAVALSRPSHAHASGAAGHRHVQPLTSQPARPPHCSAHLLPATPCSPRPLPHAAKVVGVAESMSYFTCPACSHRATIFAHGGARQAAADLGIDFLAQWVVKEGVCLCKSEAVVAAYKPHIVIACCLLDDGTNEGASVSPLGVDWTAAMRRQPSAREYILVGGGGICDHHLHTWRFPDLLGWQAEEEKTVDVKKERRGRKEWMKRRKRKKRYMRGNRRERRTRGKRRERRRARSGSRMTMKWTGAGGGGVHPGTIEPRPFAGTRRGSQ